MYWMFACVFGGKVRVTPIWYRLLRLQVKYVTVVWNINAECFIKCFRSETRIWLLNRKYCYFQSILLYQKIAVLSFWKCFHEHRNVFVIAGWCVLKQKKLFKLVSCQGHKEIELCYECYYYPDCISYNF